MRDVYVTTITGARNPVRSCSLCRNIQIVPGTYEDYKQLAQYHYRDSGPGQFTKIFALRPNERSLLRHIHKGKPDSQTIGVIVYSTATLGQQLRNIATEDYFLGFDRDTRLALLNKNVRRISRVIIEPRFRGLGLGTKLVRETMPLLNVPVIEASAVMGHINPFFEKAGMTAYIGPEKKQNSRLKEALSATGIEESMLIDPAAVHKKIESLDGGQAPAALTCVMRRRGQEFIENEIRLFLTGYGDRRYSRPSLNRTTFVLNKLTTRPVYYIWFNPEFDEDAYKESEISNLKS
jgi:hypothetical protein